MNSTLLSNIKLDLLQKSSEETKKSSEHFFKENVLFYGVKSADIKRIASAYYKKFAPVNKEIIIAECKKLFKAGHFEEAMIACYWMEKISGKLATDDFIVLEQFVATYVSNWAVCDTLCNHAVGSFIMWHPVFVDKLFGWAKSDNRWVKRAAAVSLIIPARKGMFIKDIFTIADILLLDKDDMVQKGYGWMLKEASKAHQEDVFDYVVKHKDVMPRTALRYAIEKMPETLRKKAMQK